MSKKRKKRVRFRITYTLIAIIMMIAYCVMMFPTASDLISRIGQETSIGSYDSDVANMSEEDINACIEKTKAYNAKIADDQKEHPFTYQGGLASDTDYRSVPLPGTEKIGVIAVPKVSINLPIYHGTDDEMLQYAAGHLYGTSIPIGGESTHSVIAAHTALSTAKLFSELEHLKLGDEFEVRILNMIHVYEVDQIEVALPEDADSFLQIQDGEDYVTLYTCTPYGINSHRLLIRGKRLPDRDQVVSNDELNMLIKNRSIFAVELAGLCLVPIIVIIIAIIADRKEKKKRQEKMEAKELEQPYRFN